MPAVYSYTGAATKTLRKIWENYEQSKPLVEISQQGKYARYTQGGDKASSGRVHVHVPKNRQQDVRHVFRPKRSSE